jgi:hypothetical protein
MKPERRRFCVAAVTLPDFRAWGTRNGASQLSFRTRNRIRTNFRDVDGLPLALSVGQLLRVPIRGIRGHRHRRITHTVDSGIARPPLAIVIRRDRVRGGVGACRQRESRAQWEDQRPDRRREGSRVHLIFSMRSSGFGFVGCRVGEKPLTLGRWNQQIIAAVSIVAATGYSQ